MLTGRHLIQPDDLSVSEIEEICSLAEQIIVDPSQFESDEPLKTVELPVAETPLSIEEALALNDAEEQKADTDAEEEKP